MSFEYVCSKCGRRCKNAGALAMHMKKHKKKRAHLSIDYALLQTRFQKNCDRNEADKKAAPTSETKCQIPRGAVCDPTSKKCCSFTFKCFRLKYKCFPAPQAPSSSSITSIFNRCKSLRRPGKPRFIRVGYEVAGVSACSYSMLKINIPFKFQKLYTCD